MSVTKRCGSARLSSTMNGLPCFQSLGPTGVSAGCARRRHSLACWPAVLEGLNCAEVEDACRQTGLKQGRAVLGCARQQDGMCCFGLCKAARWDVLRKGREVPQQRSVGKTRDVTREHEPRKDVKQRR
eukprot:364054-Chlamydomonas_euryale.AAC.10